MSENLKEIHKMFIQDFADYRRIRGERERLEAAVPQAQDALEAARTAHAVAIANYRTAVISGTGEEEAKATLSATHEEAERAQIRCEALEEALGAMDTRAEYAAQSKATTARQQFFRALARQEVERLKIDKATLDRVFCFLFEGENAALHWPTVLDSLFPRPSEQDRVSMLQEAERVHGVSMSVRAV